MSTAAPEAPPRTAPPITEAEIAAFAAENPGVLPPCEHSQHGKFHTENQPAAHNILTGCRGCGHRARYLICEEGLLEFYSPTVSVACDECDHVGPGWEFVISASPL